MTGSQIKQLSEDIMDGNVDWSDDLYYKLLNIAKVKLEEMRLWQFLKKLDSSLSISSGNNYTTAKALPSDFAQDYRITVGLSTELYPVPFEEQHVHRNTSNRYYIDYANSNLYVLGNSAGGTLYIYYKRFTPDIASGTSPVFPARFHALLAFMVVGYFQGGVDTDDIFARMSPENKVAGLELMRAMISWDTAIAMRTMNDRVGMDGGSSGETAVEQM